VDPEDEPLVVDPEDERTVADPEDTPPVVGPEMVVDPGACCTRNRSGQVAM